MSKLGRFLTAGLVGHGAREEPWWRALFIVACGIALWAILR